MNKILCAAGLLGFSAIALGAYGDHSLRGSVDTDVMRSYETAIRYHIIHALALLALGIGLSAVADSKLSYRLFLSAYVIFIGTLVFSGSIYTSVIFDIPSATIATPFGGIALMAGWLMIIWAGFIKQRL